MWAIESFTGWVLLNRRGWTSFGPCTPLCYVALGVLTGRLPLARGGRRHISTEATLGIKHHMCSSTFDAGNPPGFVRAKAEWLSYSTATGGC